MEIEGRVEDNIYNVIFGDSSMKNKKELPCLDCKHADITCGEVMCTLEGKAVHLIKVCPETGEGL